MRSPPLNHIYLWSGWIDKLNAPRVEARGHPHPLPEVFLRIIHISETILSILVKLCPHVPWMILFQSYVRYVWDPKKGTRGGLKWLIILIFKKVSYLFIKQDQMILTCNSAVASDAFSIFFIHLNIVHIYSLVHYVYVNNTISKKR